MPVNPFSAVRVYCSDAPRLQAFPNLFELQHEAVNRPFAGDALGVGYEAGSKFPNAAAIHPRP